MFRISKPSATRCGIVASRLRWAALGTCMAACPVAARGGTAAPPLYTMTDLQAAAPANVTVSLTAINDSGEAAGSYGAYPATYRNGTFQVIPTANGYSGFARAISSNGLVTGDVYVPFLGPHGFVYAGTTTKEIAFEALDINASGQVIGFSGPDVFLYSGGTTFDLGKLGLATSINNAGQIVGYNSASAHAFLYDGGGLHDLGTLGGNGSEADVINDSGQIAGAVYGVGGLIKQAFLDSNGTVQDLGVPSGFHLGGTMVSFPLGISDAGEVVGVFGDSPATQAFLYDNGTMYNLNDLVVNRSGIVNEAYAINSSGEIVGTMVTPSGEAHAVLLTPAPPVSVPLPKAAWTGLATLGLVMLVGAARRGRSATRT